MPYKDAKKEKEYQKKYRSEHVSNWKKYSKMPYFSYEARKEYFKNYFRTWIKTEGYKKFRAKKAKEYRIRNPIKFKARYMVFNALKTGKLSKPKNCSSCGGLTKVEGHHKDHSKPLEVDWLCKSCHRLADKKPK